MKFEQNEMPHEKAIGTARILVFGDIVFDEEGIPWVVGEVAKHRTKNPDGTWNVPVRQAVYHNNMKGSGWINPKGPICVAVYEPDEMVPTYDQSDLVRVVETDMDKYLHRR